jgi:hypothetical protein
VGVEVASVYGVEDLTLLCDGIAGHSRFHLFILNFRSVSPLANRIHGVVRFKILNEFVMEEGSRIRPEYVPVILERSL